MPIRKLVSVYEDLQARDLKARLAEEFRHPQEQEPEPVIVEETSVSGMRLYVIWSAWSELDQRVRSKIILDAYQEARSQLEALKVKVAMGLTPQEATVMGIRYV